MALRLDSRVSTLHGAPKGRQEAFPGRCPGPDSSEIECAIDVYMPLAYTSGMSASLHTVVETPQFLRDAATAGISDDECKSIVNSVAVDPRQGVEIRGSGGVRKFRVAGRGKGKSGGYRVIAAYFGSDIPVYLLALLSKGDRANFSDREIASFKTLTAAIALYWRKRRTK